MAALTLEVTYIRGEKFADVPAKYGDEYAHLYAVINDTMGYEERGLLWVEADADVAIIQANKFGNRFPRFDRREQERRAA